MKFLAAFLFFALSLVSCAGLNGQVAYDGPVFSTPVVEFHDRIRLDSVSDPVNPHWVKDWFLTVSNTTFAPMAVDVECDTFVFRNVELPPRTTQHILVDRRDLNCSARRR